MTVAEDQHKTGILLLNLGTPDAPTPGAIRRFLRDFLSDPRVVEMPRLPWWFILHLFILPWRPHKVAALYRKIWQTDSPQRLYANALATALAQQLQWPVATAMTYGNPSMRAALSQLLQQRVERILVLPLFPQYSATTTGAAFDALSRELGRLREVPELLLVKDYWEDASWQELVVARLRQFRQQHGGAKRLLFSFHGIPLAYAEKGDRYPERCRQTSVALAERLGLQEQEWAVAFQSRFGSKPWVMPYTDVLLADWARDGIDSIQVICPGFAFDCLETLEEIAMRNRAIFLAAGGAALTYIPALNADADHVAWLAEFCRRKNRNFSFCRGTE